MTGQPLWRRTLIDADRRAAPLIARVQRSDEFATVVGVNQKLRRSVARLGTRTSRRALHLLNLPAGTDITRLLVHIASVEREIRELRKVVALRPDVESEPHLGATPTVDRRSKADG
jgi:hypothetical protein